MPAHIYTIKILQAQPATTYSLTMSYQYCLGENEFTGNLHGIQLIWGPTAITRLPQDADKLGVPQRTLKSLTENFNYLCARRLGCDQVNILYAMPYSSPCPTFSTDTSGVCLLRGAPHAFTTNSSTGSSKVDLDHVSGQFSAARPDGLARKGRYKVHVYLNNVGVGKTAYDNVGVDGERVVQKNKGPDTLRRDLCKGKYPALDAR